MRRFQCVAATYVYLINEFLTISFLNKFSTTSFIQRNEQVEMKNNSCSLPCTWMTIINCLFILLIAYLEMFHGSKLLNCKLLGCTTYHFQPNIHFTF